MKQFLQYFDFTSFLYCTIFDFLSELFRILGPLWLISLFAFFKGILRFYRGYAPALLQGPISRFGDTAANVGILALLEPHHDLPIAVKTGAASLSAGLWRIMISMYKYLHFRKLISRKK